MLPLNFQMKQQDKKIIKNKRGMGSEELIKILLYVGAAIAIAAGLFYLIKKFMP